MAISTFKVTLLLSLVWVGASLVHNQVSTRAGHAPRGGKAFHDEDKKSADHSASLFGKNVHFEHRLRVCNAYPSTAGFDIFKGREAMMSNIRRFKGQVKLTELPLEYKMCGDFHVALAAGDEIKFTIDGANAGTFEISDLPNNDAVLLLVVQRHDVLTNAIAFQSHVFANLLNAQIAVIDTYKGRARSHVQVADLMRKEDIKYNQLVAMNPGMYQISLVDNRRKIKSSQDFVAVNRESYVAFRVGIDNPQNSEFPEELVVYPASDPMLLGSSPHSSTPIGMLMMTLLIAMLRY